jgi:hypothetical protein
LTSSLLVNCVKKLENACSHVRLSVVAVSKSIK